MTLSRLDQQLQSRSAGQTEVVQAKWTCSQSQQGAAESGCGSRALDQDAALRLDHHPPVSISVAGDLPGLGLFWSLRAPIRGGWAFHVLSFASSLVQSFIHDTLE